jgi:hypothetical protein
MNWSLTAAPGFVKNPAQAGKPATTAVEKKIAFFGLVVSYSSPAASKSMELAYQL